ncbi:MAG: hypothetical protein COW73_07695 [Nitrospirae bacterium CG18_big_fil_WC_8_21_14_2_50_70_55]|nr:MAG: hypothetical protein COW73_07695 [Nitrospirae bacterium CG18_big_fil_WC_8_21_14_2_50_70_55]
MCSDRKSWWTEQWPAHRITRARARVAALLPPSSWSGSHTTIASSGIPMAVAVLRPRCWSGKKRTRGRWAKAQARTRPALEPTRTTSSAVSRSS